MKSLPGLLILTLSATAHLRAEEPESATFAGKGVSLTLVSGVKALQAGQPFDVGVLLQHENGYHTYWQNPGLAGVPTKLEWSLPEGFSAAPIVWPAPEKVKMAALNTHGYEKDTLLVVRITPPATLPDSPVTLRTRASWMACARQCNPGFCHLALTLPTAATTTPNPEWQGKLDAVRANQPPSATGWTFTAVRHGETVDFTAKQPADRPVNPLPDAPQFFSADNLICSDPVQEWSIAGDTLRCTLTVSTYAPDEQTRLRGLLFCRNGWPLAEGKTEYLAIDVPVTTE